MKRSKCIIALAIAFSLSTVVAQDFNKNYNLPPDGRIVISLLRGDIKISGYEGKEIEVVVVNKGSDRDLVEIQDSSFGNRIHLIPQYKQYKPFQDVSVDFEIRVPKTVRYNFEINVTSGKITVYDVMGFIGLESRSSSIELRDVQGIIKANSINGNIICNLSKTFDRNDIRLSSNSGNVSVQAPADLSARVYMESSAGRLKTDFPLEIQGRRYGQGQTATGKLGAGNQFLSIRSAWGSVNLDSITKRASGNKEN